MGFILNNYAATDFLATLARLAIGGAILTSYPFAFSALRDGIQDFANQSGKKSNFVKVFHYNYTYRHFFKIIFPRHTHTHTHTHTQRRKKRASY